MARTTFIAGACLLALAACSKTDQEASPKAPAPKPGPSPTANALEGVSSDGKTYALAPAVANTEAGAAAASTGTNAALAATGAEMASVAEATAQFETLKELPAVRAPVGVEQIIGTDDRRKVAPTTTYPERAQVLIALPGGRCSGALVGPDLVVTAGHCVHSGGAAGAWMSSATVYPGRNGIQTPYGSCRAKRFYSVLGWTRDKNPQYDFGAIKLDCDIGARTGWLGYFWQSQSLIGKSARISSYPGDKPLDQWTHKDKVTAETAQQTQYLTDTMPGNSGSAVFAEGDAPAGCNGPCVHTVHAYGSTSSNSGTRITQPLFANLNRWKAEPR
jgi:glutamyl endopeptidase